MKIAAVETYPIFIDFNERHKNTSIHEGIGMQTGIGYVIVKIHTEEGITGIGEVGRFFEGETLYSVVSSIDKIFAPAIMGLDPMNIRNIHRLMTNQVNEINWAKSAIDLAIYDIMGKSLGVPVHVLLGGKQRDWIPVCPTLFIKQNYADTIADAVYYVEQGFQTLKVKIGNDPVVDIALISQIRKAVGNGIAIRVDANQGYNSADAVKILREMEKNNLMLIEQPCPKWDVAGMKKVSRALDTPVITCESVRTPHEAMNFILQDAVDGINIKLGRPAGLFGSWHIAAVAEAAGLPVAVGTMMELGIGTAAALHFAACLRDLPYPSDTYGALHLEDDIILTPLEYKCGSLKVPDTPGLGIELNDEKLIKYKVKYGAC